MNTKLSTALVCLALATPLSASAFSFNDLKDAAKAALEKTTGDVSTASALSHDDIIQGLKEALTQGAEDVISQLGTTKGFSGDPAIRIPLPASLVKARKLARKVGLDGYFDDLELKLNQAAEAATPKAKTLFVGAIKDMSVSDAKDILQGPDDAATRYFRDKTGAELQKQMRPIVDKTLADVGAVSALNRLLERYNAIPFAPKVDADLTGHVVEKGADGIFHYLAEEEKAIRQNPVKRTTKILQRVFGN